MTNLKTKKIGAFVVPTGIGASIGGYAGDASSWARRFAKEHTLIVNPNVVNAGGFSGITDNMLYVEGYSLDEFFKGNISLLPSCNNKVGVVFDKGISQDVLNIHINTINAVKTVYDIDIIYGVTEEDVGVEFFIDNSGVSTGRVKNIKTLLPASEKLLNQGADAIAVVCKFSDDIQNEDYENGVGVDPIGGVEAIISHYLSRELLVPVAHSPAFDDFSISTKIVDPKASSEYITPTFLPCILLGLHRAPLISKEQRAKREENNCTPIRPFTNSLISVSQLDFLVMPYSALGSTPVFEALKRCIRVFAVRENKSVLDVSRKSLKLEGVVEVDSYGDCLNLLLD